MMETVMLRLPKKAEFVSLARLTASGIASKVGFDFDAIEDIKVAVSEICSKIVALETDAFDYQVHFDICDDKITVRFSVSCQLADTMFTGEDGEFAYSIISTLMDDVSVNCCDGCIFTMTKMLGRTDGDE